jgi:regulator of sigma E protease
MIDESMDKEQMVCLHNLGPLKPAYQRLIIMLGGVTVNFILALLFIGMAFAYGDTYVANTDFKDGMLFENPPCKSGFQNGRQNPGCRWEPIVKFDNDINEGDHG